MGAYEISGLAYCVVGICVALAVLRDFDWQWKIEGEKTQPWEFALTLGCVWPVFLYMLAREWWRGRK